LKPYFLGDLTVKTIFSQRIRQAAILAFLGMIVVGIQAAQGSVAPVHAQTGTGIIRVDPVNGTDSLSCGSEGTPCQTIQHAVDIAESGATIRLAGGSYFGTGSEVVRPSNTKTVAIIGGYSASNWNTSNPAANVSVIDGGGNKRGFYIIGGGATVNLQGLTIQNGFKGGSGADVWGGGIYCTSGSTVTLTDVIIKNNKAQGNPGNINTAAGGGAAFFACNLTMTDVLFDNNQAIGANSSPRGAQALGGGLFATDHTTVIGTNVMATNNIAQAGDSTGSGDSGGRADANGGGIAIGDGMNATFTGLTLTGNHSYAGDAASYGGFGTSGGLHIEQATVSVTDALIKDNTATAGYGTANTSAGASAAFGAGLVVNHSTVTLDRVRLINNEAIGKGVRSNGTGGGLYVTSYTTFTSLTASNLVVANNKVTGTGDGYSLGGGLGIDASGYRATVTLNHATFSGNQLGTERTGIAINIFANSQATTNINYSIIANHTNTRPTAAAVFVGAGTTINLNHTLWHNNINNWATGGTVNDKNPHSGDPAFVSADAPNYDYHIQNTSAAIDLASGSSTTTDLDGENRPYGSASDIGADENAPPLGTSSASVSPANIDADAGSGPTYSVAFTTVVKNSSGQAVAASLTDVLTPPGSPITVGSPTALSCSTGTCGTSGGNVTWSGTVPANGQVTISYNRQVNVPTSYTAIVPIPNDVTISYSGYPDVALSGNLLVNGKLVYLPLVIK
jgi:hypothetical protein